MSNVEMARAELVGLLNELLSLKGTAEQPGGAPISEQITLLMRQFPCDVDPQHPRLSDRWRFAMRLALVMAETSYRRLGQPACPVPAVHAEQLAASLAHRPRAEATFSQCVIDPDSTLRRAQQISLRLGPAPARLLLIGDDDATSLALMLIAHHELTVIDIDPQVLQFIEAQSQALGRSVELATCDITGGVPTHLRSRFDAVVVDPIRDAEGCLHFLRFGRACLANDGPGLLFWADHPTWNTGFDAVIEALPSLGLAIEQIHEDNHCYPPMQTADDRALYRRVAHFYGIEFSWFERLAQIVRIWSHLYVLRRQTGLVAPDGNRNDG